MNRGVSRVEYILYPNVRRDIRRWDSCPYTTPTEPSGFKVYFDVYFRAKHRGMPAVNHINALSGVDEVTAPGCVRAGQSVARPFKQ